MNQSQTPVSPKTFVILRIIFIYIGVLLLLELCGQIAIRFIEAKHTTAAGSEGLLAFDTPLIGFFLKRDLDLGMGRWSVHTDHWGFREKSDLPLVKPAGEIRIAVVGGSTVFGWGVEDQESVPAYLQQKIDRLVAAHPEMGAKKVRVINAGCPWYASWHEAANIYFKVLEFSPDWIVVMDGLNDTAQALAPSWTPLVEGFRDVPTQIAAERRNSKGRLAQVLSGLLDLSPTLRYVHAKLKAREQMRTGAFHPEVWEQYVAYMERVKKVTDASGIRLSFFFQPVMHVDKPLDRFEIEHDGTSMVQPAFAETFRKLYLAGEARLLKSSALKVVSLKRLFADTKAPIYLDGLHYNAPGNERVAEAIFKDQIEAGLGELLVSPLARN